MESDPKRLHLPNQDQSDPQVSTAGQETPTDLSMPSSSSSSSSTNTSSPQEHSSNNTSCPQEPSINPNNSSPQECSSNPSSSSSPLESSNCKTCKDSNCSCSSSSSSSEQDCNIVKVIEKCKNATCTSSIQPNANSNCGAIASARILSKQSFRSSSSLLDPNKQLYSPGPNAISCRILSNEKEMGAPVKVKCQLEKGQPIPPNHFRVTCICQLNKEVTLDFTNKDTLYTVRQQLARANLSNINQQLRLLHAVVIQSHGPSRLMMLSARPGDYHVVVSDPSIPMGPNMLQQLPQSKPSPMEGTNEEFHMADNKTPMVSLFKQLKDQYRNNRLVNYQTLEDMEAFLLALAFNRASYYLMAMLEPKVSAMWNLQSPQSLEQPASYLIPSFRTCALPISPEHFSKLQRRALMMLRSTLPALWREI